MLRWLGGVTGTLFVMVSMSMTVTMSVSMSSSVLLLDVGRFQGELIFFFLLFVDIFTMFGVKCGCVRLFIFFFLFLLLFFTFNGLDDGHTFLGYFGGGFARNNRRWGRRSRNRWSCCRRCSGGGRASSSNGISFRRRLCHGFICRRFGDFCGGRGGGDGLFGCFVQQWDDGLGVDGLGFGFLDFLGRQDHLSSESISKEKEKQKKKKNLDFERKKQGSRSDCGHWLRVLSNPPGAMHSYTHTHTHNDDGAQ
jgi:hypothetical protein